jgi:hypothetical protein
MIKSRRKRWARYVAHIQTMRNSYTILDGKPKDTRLLARPERTWKDNIKMDVKYSVMWTGLIWLRIGFSGGVWYTM